VDLRTYFSRQEIERGRRYARPQLALGLASTVVELGSLAVVCRWPPPPVARTWTRPVAGGAVVATMLSVGLAAPPLPLSAISRRRSIAAGLDTQAWGAWAVDLLKAGAIGSGLAAAGGAAIIAATRRYPRAWWVPAAAGSVAFGALLAALAPVLLDPMFNEFTPLPEGQTRSDVLELARGAGVRVRGRRQPPHDCGQRLRDGLGPDQAGGLVRHPARSLHARRDPARGRPRARSRASP
jgi:STE24 endopeptidase